MNFIFHNEKRKFLRLIFLRCVVVALYTYIIYFDRNLMLSYHFSGSGSPKTGQRTVGHRRQRLLSVQTSQQKGKPFTSSYMYTWNLTYIFNLNTLGLYRYTILVYGIIIQKTYVTIFFETLNVIQRNKIFEFNLGITWPRSSTAILPGFQKKQ